MSRRLRTGIAYIVRRFRVDSDLASVRDAAALEKLPEAERAEWKKLWADVQTLLDKTATKK